MFFTKKGNTGGTFELMLVGLGNPGREYEKTRHNAGHMVIDRIAARFGAEAKKTKCRALISECRISGKRVLLVKPQTFMNLSGEAVAPLCRFYKIPLDRVFVMSDDVSLPVGTVRIRKKGSAGGHNGLKSIITSLGSDEFARLKIGVGQKPAPDTDLTNWVLGGIPTELQAEYNRSLDNAVAAVEEMLSHGIDSAMNLYN